MPHVIIDGKEVSVPEGSTILDAARELGLDIPALCYLAGQKPATSCMVCQVKLTKQGRFVPSCATAVEDGMRVESETEEVRQIRRSALELLLSDHVGDCVAPCEEACPTHMNIPLMLHQVAAGNLAGGIGTIKRDMALPAVLGRVCPEVCERACRRREVDSPVAICLVKRLVADADLQSEMPYLPDCKPDSGKKVAIIGAGPAGLSAAYHLLRLGHACTVFDERREPGGRLLDEFDERQLPRDVLSAEVSIIERLGVDFRLETVIGSDKTIDGMAKEFDAVLVAIGRVTKDKASGIGLEIVKDRLRADARTHATSLPGVFAAGDAVSPSNLIVRVVAHGKRAAVCIDQYLSGVELTGLPESFNCRAGRLSEEELQQLAAGASERDRTVPPNASTGGLTEAQARSEAHRCLSCECGKQEGCRLRDYAQAYGAVATRHRGTRRALERHLQQGDITYEPGKCILCGLCVAISAEAGEPLGFTFVGRGFDMRVDVPFDGAIAEGLQRTAHQCAEACPTGALVLRTHPPVGC